MPQALKYLTDTGVVVGQLQASTEDDLDASIAIQERLLPRFAYFKTTVRLAQGTYQTYHVVDGVLRSRGDN